MRTVAWTGAFRHATAVRLVFLLVIGQSGGTLGRRWMLARNVMSKRTWRWICAGCIVVALGFGLRIAYYQSGYGHPDEKITSSVVRHLRQTHDWDTNWMKTDLEEGLRYDQYNFSSYLYSTYLFYRGVKLVPGTLAWRSMSGGDYLYRFYSVLLATFVVWQTMRRAERVGGSRAALGAGLLTALAPLLIQDAHYARPEAFTTVLTLAAVALCWPESELRSWRIFGAGLVIGLLIACKVSMLLLAWIPIVPVVAAGGHRRAAGWLVLAGCGVAVALGFALGAPGAVLHPDRYVSGVRYLMAQYSGLHPPHSHFSGRAAGDLAARYFAGTLGVGVLIAAVIGVVWFVRRRRWFEGVLLAGPVLIFGGYFATRSVFFERNLSHVVPLLLILAAIGVVEAGEWFARRTALHRNAVVTLVLALLLARPAIVSASLVGIEFSQRGQERYTAFDQRIGAQYPDAERIEVQLMNTAPLDPLVARFRGDKRPVLLCVADFNDEWTAAALREVDVRFVARTVADYPGSFPGLPVCTLHTYLSPRYRYLLLTGLRNP